MAADSAVGVKLGRRAGLSAQIGPWLGSTGIFRTNISIFRIPVYVIFPVPVFPTFPYNFSKMSHVTVLEVSGDFCNKYCLPAIIWDFP